MSQEQDGRPPPDKRNGSRIAQSGSRPNAQMSTTNTATTRVAELPAPTRVDAVYEYTIRDLRDFGLTRVARGDLVRINLGSVRSLDLTEMNNAAHLAYGATRVQVVGNTAEVGYLCEFIERRLSEWAEMDEQREAELEQAERDFWGDTA